MTQKEQTTGRFSDLGIAKNLLDILTKNGFETPTPIQHQIIPGGLEGKDVVGIAQTGTGKTGAFALPCLQKIDPEIEEPQLLILSPTRELALQIAKEVKKFSKRKKYIKSVALYGGADLRSQSRALAKGCQVVVGTPGRTLDFLRQGRLDLSGISMLVLDEADEMLKMGFQDDLEAILSETPKGKQSLLFSATMPKQIEKIAKKYMHNPDRVSVGERNSANTDVAHHFILTHRNDRYQALTRLVDCLPAMYGIIFCRTKVETNEIAGQLRKDGYPVDVLNGDLNQGQRDRVMGQFRRREIQILVATDVAARGLDVNNLTHIINFNLPDDLEVYVHRSGRTGRAGNEGAAISFVTNGDRHRIRALEKMTKSKFEQRPIPTGTEIAESQLNYALSRMDSFSVPDRFKEKFSAIISEKIAGYSTEELQDKILALLCGSILHTYQDSVDLNDNAAKQRSKKNKEKKKGRDRDRGPRKKKQRKEGDAEKYTRCVINIGRNIGLNPHRLMGLVNENMGHSRPDFGVIDIRRRETVFDFDKKNVQTMLNNMKGVSFEGMTVEVRKED